MKLEALLGLLRAAVVLRQCDRGNHAWQYEPAREVHGRTYGPYRVCRRCFTGLVLATEPPTKHPDNDYVPLAPEDLRVLAELDLSL